MPPTYAKHELVSLKQHPSFNEAWLQQRIVEDPAIIGLGNLLVIERERSRGGVGRLDLLLSDPLTKRRYEVELMLGATDPSHVIRAIEYWDIERRHFPAYDHVAVLIAEDITSRFLNVLSLFAGSVPLMAFQLSALQVQDLLVLNFVRVLDQTELRTDDEAEVERKPTDREDWERRSTPAVVALMDNLFAVINAYAQAPKELNFNQQFIGLRDGGRARNFVMFCPRKKYLKLYAGLAESSQWQQRFVDLGIDAGAYDGGLWLNLTPEDQEGHGDVVNECIQAAVRHYEE